MYSDSTFEKRVKSFPLLVALRTEVFPRILVFLMVSILVICASSLEIQILFFSLPSFPHTFVSGCLSKFYLQTRYFFHGIVSFFFHKTVSVPFHLAFIMVSMLVLSSLPNTLVFWVAFGFLFIKAHFIIIYLFFLFACNHCAFPRGSNFILFSYHPFHIPFMS